MTLRALPSHSFKDYHTLLKELRYFYGNNQATYNIADVDAFTSKWRQRQISTLDKFVRYHRNYIELVGEAMQAHLISPRDFNRYFWEGLPESLRIKIEYHMLATEPTVDPSEPFEMDKIVSAAEYLLSPKRFDKHILRHPRISPLGSESEPEIPSRKQPSARESSSDEESADEVMPLYRPKSDDLRPKPSLKAPMKISTKPQHKVKKEEDIIELARRLGDMSLSDSDYTALYVDIVSRDPTFKDAFETPKNRAARMAQKQANNFQRSQFPTRQFPPQTNRLGPGPGRGEIRCFGCGQTGHHIRECEEISSMLQKGVIIRDSYTGRFTWPDGSRINRRENESWKEAVNSVKQANLLLVGGRYLDPESVYNYQGVVREEEDADTEDQEELGWSSGEICDREAYSAERTQKISKDTRQKVQQNQPHVTQRVKKLPKGVESHRPGRPQPPIQKGPNLNTDQLGPPKRIAPMDVNKDEFKGQGDHQFLPMQIDQEVMPKPANDSGKNLAHQGRTNIIKVSNPGSTEVRDSITLANEIMKGQVTLSVREAIRLAPKLRRDLVNVTKQEHEASPPVQEKIGLLGDVISGEDISEPDDPDEQTVETFSAPAVLDPGIAVAREELITIPTRINGVPMVATFDSGSQISIISRELVEQAGLPWKKDRNSRIQLRGIGGTVAKCTGKVPSTEILITDCNLPTYEELYVNPYPAGNEAKLIFGRTFGTANKVNLREEDDGTYLSFLSEGSRYEINACPAHMNKPKKIPHEDYVPWARKKLKKHRVCATAVKEPYDRKLEESDGEIEDDRGSEREPEISAESPEEGEADIEYSPKTLLKDELSTPAQPSRLIDKLNEVLESNREFDGDSDGEDERHAETLKAKGKSHASKQPIKYKSKGAKSDARFTIDSNLHESFIKFVQDGRSNDEWNAFCNQETRRLLREKRKWQRLNMDDYDTGSSEEDRIEPSKRFTRSEAPPPPDTSQTLSTLNPNPPPYQDTSEEDPVEESDHRSKIVATRRSNRTRRLTERAKGAENQRLMRTYQRRQKMTRKAVESQGAPITTSDIYAYAVNLAQRVPEEELEELEDPGLEDNPVCDERHSYDFETDESCYYPTTEDEANLSDTESSEDSASDDEEAHPRSRVIEPDEESKDRDNPETLGSALARMAMRDESLTMVTQPDEYRVFETREVDREGESDPLDRVAHQCERSQTCDTGVSQHGPPAPEEWMQTLTNQSKDRMRMEEIIALMAIRDDASDRKVSKGDRASPRKRVPKQITSWSRETYPVSNQTNSSSDQEGEDNESLYWSDHAGAMVEEEPIKISSDQTRDKTEVQTGPESNLLTDADPWNLPKKTRDGEQCPSPDHELGTLSRGFLNDVDGSELDNILNAGIVLDRYMDFDRGPRNLEMKGSLEQYACGEIEYESGSEHDYYQAPEPVGLRYVPRADRISNGMMAAIDLIPYANDQERREHHFMAYGVTLATENRYGKVVYYNGDANIRVTEPQPGIIIEVPNREKANKMRKRMFGMSERKDRRVTTIINQPEDETPAGNKITWNTLEQEELKAVLDDITAAPMTDDEVVRNYTIWRRSDGVVQVTKGFHEEATCNKSCDQNQISVNPERKNNEVELLDNAPEEPDQIGLTKLGSDPPTPDRASKLEGRVQADEGPHVHSNPWEDIDPRSLCGKILNKVELGQTMGVNDIKERETYLSKSPTPELSIQESATTEPTTDGQYVCEACKQSRLTTGQPLVPVAPRVSPSAARKGRDVPEPLASVLGGADDLHSLLDREDDPPSNQRDPGVLVASHLVELNEDLPPGHRSYAAFNGVIISDIDTPYPFGRHGNAYIRLISSDPKEHQHGRPDFRGRPPIAQDAREYYSMTKRFLDSCQLGPRADTPRPLDPRKISRTVVRDPVSESTSITITDETGQGMTLIEALDALRDLRTEVRFDKSTPEYLQPIYEDVPESAPVPQKNKIVNLPPTDPPNLSYPPDVEPYEVIRTEEAMGCDNSVSTDASSIVPDLDKVSIHEDSDTTLVSNTESIGVEDKETMKRILANLDYLSPELDKADNDNYTDLIAAMAEIGLLQVMYDIGEAKHRGKDLDKKYWKKQVFDALVKKDEFQQKLDKLMSEARVVKDAKAERETKISMLAQKIQEDVEQDEDVHMATHQVRNPQDDAHPLPPPTPTDWYPDLTAPPYSPASPTLSEVGTVYTPDSISIEDLDAIKERVSLLEDRVENATSEWKDRIRQLETQMWEDGCTLTELKWKQAEMRKLDTKMEGRMRNKKKGNRRGVSGPPTHRYPTRYATSVTDEKLFDIRNDVAALTNRVRAIEERLDGTRQEIDRLKSRTEEVLALAPRLEELARTVELHRKEQADTNSVLLSEVGTFRSKTTPNLEGQIQRHAIELENLKTNYQQLYALASQLLYSAQVSAYGYRGTSQNSFSPINVPEKKPISAF